MIKILVLSDSHGDSFSIKEAVRREKPFDELIFCGDGIRDLESVRSKKAFIVNSVTGNVDRAEGCSGDIDLILEFDKVRAYISHGDYFSVKQTLAHIKNEALRRRADLVIFGHTHNQIFDTSEKCILLNPGSIRSGCYALVEIDNELIEVTLKSL